MNELQYEELKELQRLSEEELEGFRIDGLEKLNWVFKKLDAINAKTKDVENLRDAEVERINKWAEKEIKNFNHSKEYFETLIKNYHLEQLRINPKQKTINTPYGSIKSVTRKASVVKRNETDLLDYLFNNNREYVKEKLNYHVDWANFKKNLHIIETDTETYVVDENGQVVNGVEVEPEKITFKVEL